jgi:transcription factor TFIIIB component B''
VPPTEPISTPLSTPASIVDTTRTEPTSAPPTQTGQAEPEETSWTAVNRARDGDETEVAVSATPATTLPPRQPPKPRATRRVPAISNTDSEQQQPEAAVVEESEAQQTPADTGARTSEKRKADAVNDGEAGDGAEASQPPEKKKRKPRVDKGKKKADNTQAVDEGAEPTTDAAAKPRKPRQPRKKRPAASQVEGGDGETAPKRKGRPPREATPSDTEDQTIDPDTMCMDNLASHNIRVGKLSNREKEMRKIDWVAVKQRRREEDMRIISTKETQEAVDKLLAAGETEQPTAGPRIRMVDGRIELIQDSGMIDREADADREIDAMIVTEEDDLTTRITSRSFMKTGKRFPNEFVLPGQGKRWNTVSTEMFYQGLRSFGTDFQMIAHMFPGATRRSIKTKFTREERENPELVKEALRGESQLASHWDQFLEASQLEEESFADADKIKQQLQEEEARMREQIDAANLEREERNRQRKAAGLTDGDDAANKENGKGKRKRKQKEKHVAFQEEGVEILGDVDDDPNWGQD